MSSLAKFLRTALLVAMPSEDPDLMLIEVLTYGAKKYSRDNWREVEPQRYAAAMMRHWRAHLRGEFSDPESRLPHLAHAYACAVFLTELDHER